MTKNDPLVQAATALYCAELERVIAARATKNAPASIRRILNFTRNHPPYVHTPGPGRQSWVWSDLHLRHANIIRYCSRPFGDVEEMNRALIDAWRRDVGDRDTILNGGDIALGGSLKGKWRTQVTESPGHKVLVVGNHDFDRRRRRLDAANHAATAGLCVIDTDPPMVLTHLPMDELPGPEWVNLYGHVHNNEQLRDTAHINVCVEHTGYRPVLLNDLVILGKRTLTQGAPPPGTTTRERIDRALREARSRGRHT